MNQNLKVAILGTGNLGMAIAEGLLKSKAVAPSSLFVTRRKVELLDSFRRKKVNVLTDNREAAAQADFLFLTVKPHQAEMVLEEIKPALKPGQQVIVSAVTGFSMEKIIAVAGKKIPVVRIMPNTAVAIGESITCMTVATGFDAEGEKVEKLLSSLGRTLRIREELMEASTVLGACGVAFALRFLRALTQGGIEIGFSAETAQFIAAQTMRGAAGLILENGQHPEKEIDKVTTPMGITISGLNEMEHNGFSSSLIKGLVTSYTKISSMKAKN